MRSLLITQLLAFPALGLALLVYFGTELKQFVAATPAIRSQGDLDQFKQVVKRQMYIALAQIVILMIPIVVLFYGFFSKILVATDVVYVIIPSLIILAAGMYFKTIERQAQTLPVADPDLQRERDRVVDVWKHKPFPDW